MGSTDMQGRPLGKSKLGWHPHHLKSIQLLLKIMHTIYKELPISPQNLSWFLFFDQVGQAKSSRLGLLVGRLGYLATSL
jgi:hypothetical protein